MDERELVNEVIRELKKRMGQDKMQHESFKRRVLILGDLTLSESESLSGCILVEEQEPHDMVIAAQLSLAAMAQVAQGNPQSREALCILNSLLEGRQVFVLQRGLEYRQYREKAVKTLYRLYQEYEERICQYGVNIIGDISEIREQAEMPGRETQAGCVDLTGTKVLTETNFIKVRSGGYGSVLIGRNAVITPLAKDYAVKHRIRLERQ